MNIKSVFKRIKEAFKGNRVFKPTIIDNELSAAPPKIKRPGRGAYFHNNRRRTRGRNIQYVAMPDGRTRVIRHETI